MVAVEAGKRVYRVTAAVEAAHVDACHVDVPIGNVFTDGMRYQRLLRRQQTDGT